MATIEILEETGDRTNIKMSLEDILKLRGKYAGDISVEQFLEQKYEDVELEEKYKYIMYGHST